MFTWDPSKALANFEKHRISFEEAATVFADPNALEWEDLAHSVRERRFKRLGKSLEGRVLLLVYTLRRLSHGEEAIRIISARQAGRKERKRCQVEED